MSPQEIWLADSAAAPRVSLAYVHHRVADFEDRTRRERRKMLALLLFSSVYLLWMMWTRFAEQPVMQVTLGAALALGIVWHVRWVRNMTPLPFDARSGVLDSLRYFRGELVRESDARRRSWRENWMLQAVAMPAVLAVYAFELRHPVVVIGILVPLLAGALVLNYSRFRRTVAGLQKEIEGLDSLITY